MPQWVGAYFFGLGGVAASMILSCASQGPEEQAPLPGLEGIGAAYGTAKIATGLVMLAHLDANKVARGLIPAIMAGIIGIYGLIVGVVILGSVPSPDAGEYPSWKGFVHMGAGLSTGFAGLAAGLSLGTIGEYGVRAYAQQNKIFAPMVLCLIFSEALAIYGTISGLVCATKNS